MNRKEIVAELFESEDYEKTIGLYKKCKKNVFWKSARRQALYKAILQAKTWKEKGLILLEDDIPNDFLQKIAFDMFNLATSDAKVKAMHDWTKKFCPKVYASILSIEFEKGMITKDFDKVLMSAFEFKNIDQMENAKLCFSGALRIASRKGQIMRIARETVAYPEIHDKAMNLLRNFY